MAKSGKAALCGVCWGASHYSPTPPYDTSWDSSGGAPGRMIGHNALGLQKIIGIFVLKVGNLAILAILVKITNFQDCNTYNFRNPSAIMPSISPRAPLELSRKVSHGGVGLRWRAFQPTPRRAVLPGFWGHKIGRIMAMCPVFTPAGDRLLGNI